MKSRFIGIGWLGLLGVLCTTASAYGQQSGLAVARDRAQAQPSNGDAALAYARALRRAGQENEALTELRRARGVVAGWPNLVAQVEWETARTHIAKRDFTQAMATCKGMSAVRGAAVSSHLCAAEAHLLWRRGTEAKAELFEANKLQDKSQDAVYAARVIEGRIRELEVRDADAEAAYRDAIAVAPNRAEAQILLGAMLHRNGKSEGLSTLRRAVEVDAHDPVAQFELARALPAGSKESIAALEMATTDRPTYVEALRALADGYVAAGKIADAKRTAAAVLRLAPNDVQSHVVNGRVALAEGRADDALKAADTASKLMPNVAVAKLLSGDAWAKKGEIDLAVEAYQAAFGLNRSDPASLVRGARACVEAGRLTTARAFASRATKDFAEYGPSWVALGDVLAADKDKAGARTAYETARKLSSVDVATVDQKIAGLR